MLLYYRLEKDILSQDVIVFKKNKTTYIGRVIAREGDTVEITNKNQLIINNSIVTESNVFFSTSKYEGFQEYPVTLKKDEFFVLADMREHGEDSRYFGPVKRSEVKGKVIPIGLEVDKLVEGSRTDESILRIHKIYWDSLSAFTAILAGMMLVYSGYVIYDNYYTGQEAFSSRELAQFKPDPNKKPKLEFKKIRKINPDVSGWIEIFDTNIDYPIVHGKSDVEYANKDVWGKSALTGSIYLKLQKMTRISKIFIILSVVII